MSNGSIRSYRYDIAAGAWSKLIDLTQKAQGGVFAGTKSIRRVAFISPISATRAGAGCI